VLFRSVGRERARVSRPGDRRQPCRRRPRAALAERGEEEESQFEVTGTVIDPSGLTIVSARSIDPAGIIKDFLTSMGRPTEQEMKFDTEVSQTTIVLQDGSEVEADVVLKDADLDVAFVRPRKQQEFTFIPLKGSAKPLEPLQDLFVIQRLDRSQNRATSIVLGMVQAVIKGPRTFYIANQELASTSLGCIAFLADGTPAGIIVTKQKQNSGDKGMGMMMNMMMGSGAKSGGSIAILRPIEDFKEDVAQANEAKTPQTAPTKP